MEGFKEFGIDTEHCVKGVFASIFILQNRLQTACEKIQTEITMKQWLLLAMMGNNPEANTLTNLGRMMGCSRQNVKKLALMLEKNGFIKIMQGNHNSVSLQYTEKAYVYTEQMEQRYQTTMNLLFEDFEEKEIEPYFLMVAKLFAGTERVESYADGLDRQEHKNREKGLT